MFPNATILKKFGQTYEFDLSVTTILLPLAHISITSDTNYLRLPNSPLNKSILKMGIMILFSSIEVINTSRLRVVPHRCFSVYNMSSAFSWGFIKTQRHPIVNIRLCIEKLKFNHIAKLWPHVISIVFPGSRARFRSNSRSQPERDCRSRLGPSDINIKIFF